MEKKNIQVNKLAYAAIFAALAILIGYLEIPWPLTPWLKLDFSEVVVLISFITIGFSYTGAVIIVRSVIRWIISGNNANLVPFFGEFMAITASLFIVLIYILATIITKTRTKPLLDLNRSGEEAPKMTILQMVINGLIVTVGITLYMTVFNYLVATPIYVSSGKHLYMGSFIKDSNFASIHKDNLWAYTVFTITSYVPFNAVKGILSMLAFETIRLRIRSVKL